MHAEAARRSRERIVELRREQRRLAWLLLGFVVAIVAAFWSAPTAIVIAIATGTIFGVGEYVVFMHIHENTMSIRNARRILRTHAR